MKPTTRRRLLRIAYTLRWHLMDLIKFQSSSAQVFLLVQRHTHTHKTHKASVAYIFKTDLHINMPRTPTIAHICRKWQQLFNTQSHTYTHKALARARPHTHLFIHVCIYGQDMRHILCSVRWPQTNYGAH